MSGKKGKLILSWYNAIQNINCTDSHHAQNISIHGKVSSEVKGINFDFVIIHGCLTFYFLLDGICWDFLFVSISLYTLFSVKIGIQSGASSLAKHRGAYFSAVYRSIQDPIAAPGLYENQEP